MSNSIENDSRQEDLQQEGSQMKDSTKCPQCGGELPANFPPGVCPACLLMQGMSPSTLHGAEGAESGSGHSGQRRSWTPPTPAELAPRFPQWEIVELLGQGGMGAVYKVRQKDLDRWAALKLLPSDVANDPNFAERFQREARTLAQLSHQHIVTVYEFGQCDGVFYLLMEFVDGVTLRQAIRAGTTSPSPVTATNTSPASPQSHSSLTATASPHHALGIVGQICDALQFAHEEGIVHRDIKPENILIDKRGRVKIADFGLAKLLGKQPHFPTLTGTHQIMGTPVYMAPEQMEGTKGVDHRADIFSLGVVFYELLTGELPLGRFAPPSQKYSLDVRLDEIVLRTLEKEPDRRYQQASDIKLDVESIRNQPTGRKLASQKANIAEKPRSLEKLLGRVLTAACVIAVVFWFLLWSDLDGRSAAYKLEVALQGLTAIIVGLAGAFAVLRVWRQSPPPDQPVTWCGLARLAFKAVLITVGSLAAFTAILFAVYTMGMRASQQLPPVDLADHARAVKRTAEQNYIAEVQRQQNEQARRRELEEQTRDPNEVNALVQFTADGVKLHPHSFGTDELTPEQRVTVEKILTEIHGKYLKVEAKHSNRTDEEGVQTVTIEPFSEDLTKLENELWTAVDTQLPVTVQKLLRQRLPLFADATVPLPQVAPTEMGGGSGAGPMMSSSFGGGVGMSGPSGAGGLGMGGSIILSNLRYQQLFGWKQTDLPIRIELGRQGKWFKWSSQNFPKQLGGGFGGQPQTFQMTTMQLDRGESPQLPAGLRRFWQEPSSPKADGQERDGHVGPLDLQPPEIGEDLGQKLLKLDGLRDADKTPWEEVEQRANELLAKYTAPADKGRIHWMAAHVYGQSDIRGHGADVTRHAQEALKYERDPVQRGWLYMYLGCAAGLVEKREEATRWHLQNYLELLPFNLPETAPELPSVGKFRGERFGPTDGEVDPDQVAVEVLQAAEVRARKEAELVRDLVKRRNVTIGLLQDLYGREYKPESDATATLRKLATEVLRDEAIVRHLLQRVWPDSIPKS